MAEPNRPLTLVWRRQVLDSLLEGQFIRTVLLSNLRRPVRWLAIEDDAELPLLDDLLICTFGNPGEYVDQLRRAGHANIGVFHFGDELGSEDTAFYAECDYIVRHYFFPKIMDRPTGRCRQILWVPNGWARGVGPVEVSRQLPVALRRHRFFFAGYAGNVEGGLPERHDMLSALRKFKIPATVILSQGFGQGLGAASYAAYMGDSCVALVPAGNSPETIRLYDALECGTVPVVVDRPWLNAATGLGAVGPPPLLTIPSWDALPAVAEIGDFADRQDQIADWWRRLKSHYAARVADVVEGAFRDAAV